MFFRPHASCLLMTKIPIVVTKQARELANMTAKNELSNIILTQYEEKQSSHLGSFAIHRFHSL
jgi:hypothetical protein